MAVSRASTNVNALRRTVSELDKANKLDAVDTAQVQMLRSMAKALDDDPSNAALWRQYREALKGLMSDDADAPGAEDLLA